MSSRDLVEFLRTQGHQLSSHMSSVPDAVAAILRDRIKPKVTKAAKDKAEEAAAKAKKTPGAGSAAAPRGEKGRPERGAARGDRTEKTGERGGREAGSSESPRVGGSRPEGGKGDATATDWDKKGAKEREGSAPRTRRFFPTQEESYDSGPRFGTLRRKPLGRPRRSRSGADSGAIAVSERPQDVEVTLPISVRDLSSLMGIRVPAIIATLMKNGHRVNINQGLEEDMVATIALEFQINVNFKKNREAVLVDSIRALEEATNDPDKLVPRPPVVTFLGHVDHGKTSLLDRIRKTKVTAGEAGGITQHTGAYRVDEGDIHVTFIDTPGHFAFTGMRARGAHVTDVAVLVVAADDGVMPQTEEAISHARAAKVPIVVALNKVDKPTANVMRCKQQLAALNLQPVEWGGDTEVVEVSALTGAGIDTLLETLSLTSEILELKAEPTRPALGVVLEAESSSDRGVLAVVLVRNGTLRYLDDVVCGPGYGRVRGLWVNKIERVEEALPSTPVLMTGLNAVPAPGDKLYVVADQETAKRVAEQNRIVPDRRESARASDPFSEKAPEVNLVLKADVQGTLEAIRGGLDKLPTEEVKLNVLEARVGEVTQSDVVLADVSKALICGFNVSSDDQARSLAEETGVEIRTYDVIYRLIDDVRDALQGQLAPEFEEQIHGHVEVRQLFKASKIGTIAGCMVLDGIIVRSDQVRLQRGGQVIHTGPLASLKRFKDDAREVKSGFDCGIRLANHEDVRVGDTLEAFAMVEKKRQL